MLQIIAHNFASCKYRRQGAYKTKNPGVVRYSFAGSRQNYGLGLRWRRTNLDMDLEVTRSKVVRYDSG